MAQGTLKENNFYRDHYHHVIIGLIGLIFFLIAMVSFVLYQLFHRPLPLFYSSQADGQKMQLVSYDAPNLLPDTILRFASKAATAAYTFDFVNYNKQIKIVQPYFTSKGWQDYLRSVSVGLLDTVVKNQLFVNGIVVGTPVISNEGPLPGTTYAWRIQIPFLVTYQSANTISKQNYYVILTVVRVPTATNPQGIGIDQFVMV